MTTEYPYELTLPNKYQNITRNIKFYETYSTKIIAGIRVRRQVAPTLDVLPEVLITASDGQKIRDKLNLQFGGNPKIGYRDRNNEIMLYINSFWRTYGLQEYLYYKKLSTTKKGDHPLGKAIDLKTPRGMTSLEYYLFIYDGCDTQFNWFKVYDNFVHCSRR